MTTLVAFLHACIDEDEAAARAADDVDPSPWGPGREEWTSEYTVASAKGDLWENEGAQGLSMNAPTAAHIARWDPARVLVECADRRAIIAIHGREHRCPGHLEWDEEPCKTLLLLAQSFRDHPDFDPAWLVDVSA